MKKNIIITGCGSAVGRVTAQLLAQHGHHVFATMGSPEGENKISAQHLRAWADVNQLRLDIIDLDVTSDCSVKKVMAEILQKTDGQIDVLINNAESGFIGLNATLSPAQTNHMFQVNVIGVDRMMKATLPYMRTRDKGLLITMSSVLSRQPMPLIGIYAATKAAVDALTVSYYYELMTTGIDVAIIQPGMISSLGNFSNQLVSSNSKSAGCIGTGLEPFYRHLSKPFLPGSYKPDLLDIAQAIDDVIDAPMGLRSLWTIVGGGQREQSIRHINQATRELVDTTLLASGLNKENIFAEC